MSDVPPYYSPPAPVPPLSPADERLWATLIHVSGIVLGWIGPLVGYLIARDRGPFVRAHSAEALNFQISIAIYYAAVVVLAIVTLGFGALLAIPLAILALVLEILAAIAANRGEWHRYPMSIHFVS